MHPAMQLRADCVTAFTRRATLSTAELYSCKETVADTQPVRYQVVSKQKYLYNVVERSTGKVKGYRYTWRAALMLALLLEARADGVKINLSGWGQ
ncbi:hypothetical protein [Pseudomonas sp. NPDC086278]|uniref:hypothetical protein n=1 Tax=Pseudomonas sp. NPDC086278 TaxID=3390646 RepID=UPI003D0385B7